MPQPGQRLQQTLESYQAYAKKQQFDKQPVTLYDPIRYAMAGKGKAVRPLLLLLAARLGTKDLEAALPAAYAVELFHNFTLLHDDIMDEAPLRRGKETVHKKWNSNVGLLSGDVLMIESYKRLAKYDASILPQLLRLYNSTAIEVCEGQQMDMDFEERSDVKITDYIEMIRLKTAVLLACSRLSYCQQLG